MEAWKERKLGDYILDIAAGPFGSNLKVECFVPTGFPIIDGANLKEFKVTDNITKYVTEEKARSLHRSIAKRNDVVVTISGNVGQISYIPLDSKYEEYLVSQRQFRVTFDSEKIYVPYLVYYFHTFEGQHKILSFANQTGVPALAQPLKNFKNIDICLPDINEQKRIAAILSSLDNKIEINRRINENLEQQAQALFKSWFVDFEPFRDQPFVESELGMIPEGWRVVNLHEIVDIKRDNYKKGDDATLHYLPIDIIPMHSLGIYEFKDNKEAQSSLQTFEKNDIIIGAMRVYFHRVVIAPCKGITRNTCFVLKPKNQNLWAYSIMQCNQNETIDFANRTSKGSTMPYAIWNNGLANYRIVLPNKEILSLFNRVVSPILEKVRDSYRINTIVSQLRDTLLPRLMSGELKVQEIEESL